MSNPHCRDEVKIWEESVSIPTYPTQPADLNPMFLEKRVYQGSSGKVYPNAFTDRVSNEKGNREYKAIFIENEFIRLMVLPEIGGRIHIGLDKTNNYDFFYRQNVIKPALVGLLGPWISGGVEFNWPQHHRPSTYMPVQYALERGEDGSCTVWLSEHEPMNRMKGMVGICLHPNKSFVEAKVRLYNRTPFVQTFLWWANVGIRVHENYQAFFPPDVTFVADHAKRAVSSFPIARNFYYGVDYTEGVDLAWYKNIPVPTSYMVTESNYDFFGGYDHAKKAGIVHVANRHVAPGKKLWTWGDAEFGYTWDRNLTDEDGPYIELMAGVFTDNQPDFSFLNPYETRTFSQIWYPIQEIGPAKNANRQLAINLEFKGKSAKVGICSTESLCNLRVQLVDDCTIFEKQFDVAPGRPFMTTTEVAEAHEGRLVLRVLDELGRELISCRPEKANTTELPAPATEPPAPSDIDSNDELYVTGLHLQQYRQATRSPEPYWQEALKRDPLDARCNTSLGKLALNRGCFPEAELCFRTAIERLTRRNPNPYDGDAFYCLGLALQAEGKLDEAYAAYYKATWNFAFQSAASYRLATLNCSRGEFEKALEHLENSLASNGGNSKASTLKAAILRRIEKVEERTALLSGLLRSDVLDQWVRVEQALASPADLTNVLRSFGFDAQLCLDIAFDYAESGLYDDSIRLLRAYSETVSTPHPMVLYALACFQSKWQIDCTQTLRIAADASPDYCFPARLQEMLVLEWAISVAPHDSKANYYLGNLYYDKRRYEDAIRSWEKSVELNPDFSIPWRNLGIAYFNARQDARKALECYARAFTCKPTDARLLYESDQLKKRTGAAASARLRELQLHPELVASRDDLTVEFITLLNQAGQYESALEILESRRFNPWEGGEGLVSSQYVWAHLLLGKRCLGVGSAQEALHHFEAARRYPENLGEGKHLLTSEAHLDYYSGLAARQLGDNERARLYWLHAIEKDRGTGSMLYFKALSARALNDERMALSILSELAQNAEQQLHSEVKIDYFATSLPNFLLFEDDLVKRNKVVCMYVLGLADLGLGRSEAARRKLEEVLQLDPNHMPAQEELRILNVSAERSAVSAGSKD